MAKVTNQEAPVAPTFKRLFVGRAWKNTISTEGENKGKEFISIRLDNNVKELNLEAGDRVELWPNLKREGKKDADYRLSIVPAVA